MFSPEVCDSHCSIFCSCISNFIPIAYNVIGFPVHKPCFQLTFIHLFCEVQHSILENAALPHVLNSVEWGIWKYVIKLSGEVRRWPSPPTVYGLRAALWLARAPAGPGRTLGQVWLSSLAINAKAPFKAAFITYLSMPQPTLSSIFSPFPGLWVRVNLQGLVFHP